MEWRIDGRYFESCNCDAICPCRTVGARRGGRSTHGICMGVLSWLVDEGFAAAPAGDDVDLSGLAAALVLRYDDDEPGSPWRFVLHVDARGDERQQRALADILLGRAGGERILALPWVRKPSELVDLRSSAIEIEHDRHGHGLRVGSGISMCASRPVETDEGVYCAIPGFDQAGTELYADELSVDDPPFEWQLSGNCAFVSDFSYSS